MPTQEVDVSLSHAAAHGQLMTSASVQPVLTPHLAVKHADSLKHLP